MPSFEDEPIHITLPGSDDDPREPIEVPPGVVVHRSPPLHPDDLDVVDGIPVTSLARTLVDLAEVMDRDELRSVFNNAHARGILDIEAVEASADRAEWRPSLPMLREVIDEFKPF